MPFGPTAVQPCLGCHSNRPPSGLACESLSRNCLSFGSQRLVATKPPSGSEVTPSGHAVEGATTHPVHCNFGLVPAAVSTEKISIDSRPPWFTTYNVPRPTVPRKSRPCDANLVKSGAPGQSGYVALSGWTV